MLGCKVRLGICVRLGCKFSLGMSVRLGIWVRLGCKARLEYESDWDVKSDWLCKSDWNMSQTVYMRQTVIRVQYPACENRKKRAGNTVCVWRGKGRTSEGCGKGDIRTNCRQWRGSEGKKMKGKAEKGRKAAVWLLFLLCDFLSDYLALSLTVWLSLRLLE